MTDFDKLVSVEGLLEAFDLVPFHKIALVVDQVEEFFSFPGEFFVLFVNLMLQLPPFSV